VLEQIMGESVGEACIFCFHPIFPNPFFIDFG